MRFIRFVRPNNGQTVLPFFSDRTQAEQRARRTRTTESPKLELRLSVAFSSPNELLLDVRHKSVLFYGT